MFHRKLLSPSLSRRPKAIIITINDLYIALCMNYEVKSRNFLFQGLLCFFEIAFLKDHNFISMNYQIFRENEMAFTSFMGTCWMWMMFPFSYRFVQDLQVCQSTKKSFSTIVAGEEASKVAHSAILMPPHKPLTAALAFLWKDRKILLKMIPV